MSTPLRPEFLKTLVAERIHDSTLRGNISRATGTSLHKRALVVDDFGDWEEMRAVAHDIKAHVIAHLDDYLADFERNATAAGATVHRVGDAAQARALVLRLAREADARLVVKSKSMTTEEIGLTHALEEAGMRTVETDLGEYIVQLAGELPSHITAPALHKNRQEIGRLFAERLGIEYSEDHERLTRVARDIMREDFLRADLGISGVNFAVAESGSICIVENEGNARMSTTLPRVHIAVMGMEKVVPDFESLGLFLNLLGRSATGQRLTCYTSVLTGPARASEVDGPRELHIVILDNGRTAMREDAQLREALYCIRCGACMNICPVYQKIGGHGYGSVYPGPIGSIISPVFHGIERAKAMPYASSLCGACAEICPVRIHLHHGLLWWRKSIVEGGHTPLAERLLMRVYAFVCARPWRFDGMGRLFRLFAPLLTDERGSLRVPLWGRARDMAPPPPKSFKQLWREREHEH